MVERLHRQLKGSLRAKMHNSNWLELLPMIMLGIRSTIKQDISAAPAQLVYGTSLRLPGDFVTLSAGGNDGEASDLATRLRDSMSKLIPTEPRVAHRPWFIPESLDKCEFVFVRNAPISKALDPPYDGPFKVVSRTYKTITIERSGKKDTITIDRVKPAFLEETPTSAESSEFVSAAPRTRSSTRVRFSS